MPRFVCEKCGTQMTSKCPNHRSVFVENMIEGPLSCVMSNWLEHEDQERWDGKVNRQYQFTIRRFLTVSYDPKEGPPPDQEIERRMIEEIYNSLHGMFNSSGEKHDFPTIDRWLCDHEWKIVAGECLFGCHVAEE